MSRRYDILAIDLDGTLLNSRGHISPRNRAAVERAMEAGLAVVFATGRAWNESRTLLRPFVKRAAGFIGAGGAMVTRPQDGRTLERSTMQIHLVERILDVFEAHDHLAHLLLDREEAGCDYLIVGEKALDPASEWWFRTMPIAAKFCRSRETADALRFTVRCGTVAREHEMSALAGALRDALGDAIFLQHWPAVTEADAINSQTHMLEVFNPDVDKWSALSKLADGLRIPRDRIAAVGDGINDVRMIRSAGLGIAMGNAVPAVAHVAGRVVGHHDDDGLAEAIEAILDHRWDEKPSGGAGDREV